LAKGGTGTRVKREAARTPQSLEDAAQFVREIGEMQREINLINAALTKKVQELTKQAQARSKPHEETFQLLFEGLYAFAQSRRNELTEEEKKKSVDLPTGVFGWRLRPASVKLKGSEDEIVAKLELLGLDRFVRIAKQVSKEAMLKEPQVAATVSGIEILQGKEDFFVKPLEARAELISTDGKRLKEVKPKSSRSTRDGDESA